MPGSTVFGQRTSNSRKRSVSDENYITLFRKSNFRFMPWYSAIGSETRIFKAVLITRGVVFRLFLRPSP